MVGWQGMVRPPKNPAGDGHDHPYRLRQQAPILKPGRGLVAQAGEERIGRTIPPDLPVQLPERADDGPPLMGLLPGQDDIALGTFDGGAKRRTDVIPGTAMFHGHGTMRRGESALQDRGQASAAPLTVEHFEMAPGAERAPGSIRQEYWTEGQRMVVMMGLSQPIPGMGNAQHQRPSRGVVDPFMVTEGPAPPADPGRLGCDLTVDLLEQGEMDGHGVEPSPFKGFADFHRQGPEEFVGGNGRAGPPRQEQPPRPVLAPEQLFCQIHRQNAVGKFRGGQADREPKVRIQERDLQPAVRCQESHGAGKDLPHLDQRAEMTIKIFSDTVQRPRRMPGIAGGVTEENVHGLPGVHAQVPQAGEDLLHPLVPVKEEEGDQAVRVDPLQLGPLFQRFPGLERRAPEVQPHDAVALASLHPLGFHFQPADFPHCYPP